MNLDIDFTDIFNTSFFNQMQMPTKAMEAFAKTDLPREFRMAQPQQAEQPVEIFVYDVIGSDKVNAEEFATMLADAGEAPLRLRLNSPGGSVWAGISMYSALKNYPGQTEVVIDGVAASAASVIAAGADKVSMAPQALQMIHQGWGAVVGNKVDLRATADILDKIDANMANIYADRSGKDAATIAEMMADETWFTADEAIAFGLADEILEPPAKETKANAKIRVRRKAIHAKIPQAAYDPDGDGDDDVAEAIGQISDAIEDLTGAIGTLTGTEEEPDDDDVQAKAAFEAARKQRLKRVQQVLAD